LAEVAHLICSGVHFSKLADCRRVSRQSREERPWSAKVTGCEEIRFVATAEREEQEYWSCARECWLKRFGGRFSWPAEATVKGGALGLDKGVNLLHHKRYG